MNTYTLLKFVHLLGVFAFLASHGVSMVVALRLRKERDRERIRALLQLSGTTVSWMYVSLAVLVGAGVWGGFQGGWWERRWIWWSLWILIAMIVLMIGMARPYYRRIRESLEMRPSGVPRVSDEDLAARLRSPIGLATVIVGEVGLVAILYLMVFKPA